MLDNPPNGPKHKKLKKIYKRILSVNDNLADVLSEGLDYNYSLDTLRNLPPHRLKGIDFEVFVFINEIKHYFDEFLHSKTTILSEYNAYLKVDLLHNFIKLIDFISTIDEDLNNINNDDLRKILDNPLHNQYIKQIDDYIKSRKEWKSLQGNKYHLDYERMVAFINDDLNRIDNILEDQSQLKIKLDKIEKKIGKKIDKLNKINTDKNIDKDILFLYFSFKDIHHGIDIIKPNDKSQKLSYKQLFKEIRDGIAHSNYALCHEGIYINNHASDNHGKDFECTIRWNSLEKISNVLKKYKKKDYYYVIQNLDNLDFSAGIEKILRNIHLEKIDNNDNSIEGLIVSENMKNMMREFFKNHPLNKNNLKFAIDILTGNKKSTFNNTMNDIFSCLDLKSMTFETLKNSIKNKKSFSNVDINPLLYTEYIPSHILLLFIYKYHIKNIQSSPRKTPNNLISAEEHRRNAFAHGNFAILPGVENILLWDPPQDKVSHVWEEIINLKTLYNDCINNLEIDYGKPIQTQSLPNFKDFRKA